MPVCKRMCILIDRHRTHQQCTWRAKTCTYKGSEGRGARTHSALKLAIVPIAHRLWCIMVHSNDMRAHKHAIDYHLRITHSTVGANHVRGVRTCARPSTPGCCRDTAGTAAKLAHSPRSLPSHSSATPPAAWYGQKRLAGLVRHHHLRIASRYQRSRRRLIGKGRRRSSWSIVERQHARTGTCIL